MFPNASLPTHILTFSKDDQETKVVSAGLVNVSIILYTLTVVLGITGNSIVIWVAGFKLKLTVTNVWLVNLAIADLIFCFTRIFSLTRLFLSDNWPFGLFLCKFTGFFKYTNMFCSVFLLAVISLDRMVCIWWPVFTRRRRTLSAARVIAVCVWIAAILFSIPYFIHRQTYIDNDNLTKCSVDSIEKAEGYNSTKVALYSIRFLCGFIFPFMVILICYTLAGVGIRRTRLSGKSRPLRVIACLIYVLYTWVKRGTELSSKRHLESSQSTRSSPTPNSGRALTAFRGRMGNLRLIELQLEVGGGLQLALEQFTAECEVAGIRSTLKSGEGGLAVLLRLLPPRPGPGEADENGRMDG
ncbi:C3a anaphylatoxin chemotactic receptor-like [Pundamilia nyererei]|uniref:C3a anaphylatoxin chemotactic receptor-like n=1 Tax=Pundamilia nyererei TaxID=303518 RepID=A0A9Y3RYY4_9CICH|nr:PREDICTED: C3a anaphylatoxin chemotactic receptor-like [Pundamilia nyererei]